MSHSPRLSAERASSGLRTGCGLCGTESLAHVVRALGVMTLRLMPSDEAVQAALQNLKKHQPLQLETGATHGAAWCTADGLIIQAREDVGRHVIYARGEDTSQESTL